MKNITMFNIVISMAELLGLTGGIVFGSMMGLGNSPPVVVVNTSPSNQIQSKSNLDVKQKEINIYQIRDFIDEKQIHILNSSTFDINLIKCKYKSQNYYELSHNDQSIDLQTDWIPLKPSQVIIADKYTSYPMINIWIGPKQITEMRISNPTFMLIYEQINKYMFDIINIHKKEKLVEYKKIPTFCGLSNKIISKTHYKYYNIHGELIYPKVTQSFTEVKLGNFLSPRLSVNSNCEINLYFKSYDKKDEIKTLKQLTDNMNKHDLYRLTFRIRGFKYNVVDGTKFIGGVVCDLLIMEHRSDHI